jgi:hypothetical protein
MKLSLIAVPCMAVLLAGVPRIASADIIDGTAYLNIATQTSIPPGDPRGGGFATNGVTLATLNNAIASSSGSVSFISNSLNYNAGYGNSFTTLQQFLTSDPGNTIITSPLSPTQSAIGTLLVLTGDVFLQNGTTYTILHDDGANLYISNTPGGGPPINNIFSQAGQTVIDPSTQFFTFSGTTGIYNAELLYVSNYLAPSELSTLTTGLFVAPPSVPEPSSIALLGTGLLTAAALLRRRLISQIN